MTSLKEPRTQDNEEKKICTASCEKVDEIIEYMKQFKKTGDIEYVDRAHYCLFKIRDEENDLIRDK